LRVWLHFRTNMYVYATIHRLLTRVPVSHFCHYSYCQRCVAVTVTHSTWLLTSQPAIMSKRRKPTLSIAAAMHRVKTERIGSKISSDAVESAAKAAASVAAATAAAASSTVTVAAAAFPHSTDSDVGHSTKKKKKPKRAHLISLFHQLMARQSDLESKRSTMTAKSYAEAREALQKAIDALGGLEHYQSLSIRGHSAKQYHAFNTSHWIIRTLSKSVEYACLRKYAKAKPPPSGTMSHTPSSVAEAWSSSSSDDDEYADVHGDKDNEMYEENAADDVDESNEPHSSTKKQPGRKRKDHAANSNNGNGMRKRQRTRREESDESADEKCGEHMSADAHPLPPVAASTSPSATFSATHRIRLLDVGSLSNHYLPYSDLIDCTAIDLNPQHPSVKKMDFFDMPVPRSNRTASISESGSSQNGDGDDGLYDVVVLSLVLNFVGDRSKRGLMIQRSLKLLRSDGVGRLFIILPAACLRNSRWINHERFVTKCMKPLGATLGECKYTRKLACMEFIKDPASTTPAVRSFRSEGIVLPGETRNNFSIEWTSIVDEQYGDEDQVDKRHHTTAAASTLSTTARNHGQKHNKGITHTSAASTKKKKKNNNNKMKGGNVAKQINV